jgi:predicted O-methyltransferase YrrM
MSRRTLTLTEPVYNYLLANSLREHPALERLRAETARLPEAGMQSAPEQAQFMALLIEAIEARHVLEIGCFTGYGTLGMALALPPEGRLLTLDVNPDWVELGRRAWREAGVEGRIEVRFGPALTSLDRLLDEGRAGSFDLIFIDADKKSYDDYYERSLNLVRPGGLILLDNVLWSGRVADPDNAERQTEALRALNAKLHADPRISLSLLPLGDGLTLARKRSGKVEPTQSARPRQRSA